MATQWSDLETYRRLLQEYERQSDEYRKLLEQYRTEQAAGKQQEPDIVELKQRLDTEQPELERLYKQLVEIRNGLAHARDAAASMAQ
jgi:hypothetical protein